MRFLGFEVRRVRKGLSGPDSGRWFRIDDHYTGAFQQDVKIELDTVLTFSAVFACVRLISTDIGKLDLRLMRQQPSGILVPQTSPRFSSVLKRPNHYQTRIKFVEQWLLSKLLHGNAYALKGRGTGGVVERLYVMDPERVDPLISDRGDVFYRLRRSQLPDVEEIVVPATEIIHDVHITPYHPLVGMGPIAAAGLPATQGLEIQKSQSKFFKNMSRPSGMLTAPGSIKQDTADRLKARFEENYGGENLGRILVGGDGLSFETFSLNAVDSQVIEQLKFTGEDVCRAFGVPGYKVGVGPQPTQSNMAALNQAYYDDALQELIVCIQTLLTEGLELPEGYSVEFDLEDLLRMDPVSRAAVYDQNIKAGWKAPNEVRLRENLPPVIGGEEPIMQQQNWPLSVLAQRAPPDTTPPPVAEESPEEVGERAARFLKGEAADDRYVA